MTKLSPGDIVAYSPMFQKVIAWRFGGAVEECRGVFISPSMPGCVIIRWGYSYKRRKGEKSDKIMDLKHIRKVEMQRTLSEDIETRMNANMKPGDIVAFAAKFLRDTCQHTGDTPLRRGVYLGPDATLAGYVRVRWDDQEHLIAEKSGNFTEEDYCADVREFGSLVYGKNICWVGSARFGNNDL